MTHVEFRSSKTLCQVAPPSADAYTNPKDAFESASHFAPQTTTLLGVSGSTFSSYQGCQPEAIDNRLASCNSCSNADEQKRSEKARSPVARGNNFQLRVRTQNLQSEMQRDAGCLVSLFSKHSA